MDIYIYIDILCMYLEVDNKIEKSDGQLIRF